MLHSTRLAIAACRASNAQSLHGLRDPSPLCTQRKKGGPKPRAKTVAASSSLSGTSASQGSDGVRDGGDVNVIGGAPTPRIGLARATVDHLAQSRDAAAGAVLGGSAMRQQHASGELGHASVDFTQSAPGVVVSCHRVDTMGGELFNWVRFSYLTNAPTLAGCMRGTMPRACNSPVHANCTRHSALL